MRPVRYASLALAVVPLILRAGIGFAGQAAAGHPFPSLYSNTDVFVTSIEQARVSHIPHRWISGLTVPHHLLAADLIAQGFTVAEGNRYDKIAILFPDHFKKTRRPFATTRRSFETVFGPVPNSDVDTSRLLEDESIIEDSGLFAKDHGIGALLPFVRHFFPNTPVIPIAVSITSTREQWEKLIADLEPLITSKTLILQSTDFSHYLTHPEAIERDQQVLNIIAADDVDAAAKLMQPAHLDSRGAQYIQMRLQAKLFNSRPVAILNSNSQLYAGGVVPETTSYIVQIYPAAGNEESIDPRDSAAGEIYCFAGDTFFGRYMLKFLSRPETSARVLSELKNRLARCPLIVNLEGVMVEKMPDALGPLTLAMPSDVTLAWLKSLNVVAVGVANNHAKDLGEEAYASMVAALEQHGIQVVQHGGIVDLGRIRLTALTDFDNKATPHSNRITTTDLQGIAHSDAPPPLLALLHWGQEYRSAPTARQIALADDLRRSGVSLVIGAHPHRAYPRIEALAGGEMAVAYSLGNFLFDQFDDRASSAILELRLFPQGTYFPRIVPLPNLYALAHRRAPGERQAGQ